VFAAVKMNNEKKPLCKPRRFGHEISVAKMTELELGNERQVTFATGAYCTTALLCPASCVVTSVNLHKVVRDSTSREVLLWLPSLKDTTEDLLFQSCTSTKILECQILELNLND